MSLRQSFEKSLVGWKKDCRRGDGEEKRQEESKWYEKFKVWTLKALGTQDKFE